LQKIAKEGTNRGSYVANSHRKDEGSKELYHEHRGGRERKRERGGKRETKIWMILQLYSNVDEAAGAGGRPED
jgi:hypothetical protein